MGSTACVVILFGGECEHRRAALRCVTDRYHAEGLETLVVEAPISPWIKAIPVRQGLESVDIDIVVLADADVICDGVREAIQAVEQGAVWSVPHFQVHRLTEQGTAAVLEGAQPRSQPLEQRPYRGVPGGGFVVARRDALLAHPMDPRFVGWGQEDEAFGWMLQCLLGNPKRIMKPLYHLWHPHPERMTRKRGSVKGWELRRRYQRAARDPIAMTRLLEETHVALNALERPSHDPQALNL